MRLFIATMAVLVMTTAISSLPVPSAIQISGASIAAQEQQPAAPATPKTDIDINVNHGGRTWYANPVWIAIGAIAVVLVIVLIATVARGGGTTVIKE
jgi:hypothetical protein